MPRIYPSSSRGIPGGPRERVGPSHERAGDVAAGSPLRAVIDPLLAERNGSRLSSASGSGASCAIGHAAFVLDARR